jgi:putative two-component system response regulator
MEAVYMSDGKEEKNSKILVVDDMYTSRLWLMKILENEGYEIAQAASGVEALQQIRAERPDLVIMDMQMPEMDGAECCQRIKKNTQISDIPVVMITYADSDDCRKKAKEAGCNAFLGKPIQKVRLLGKVKYLLSHGLQKE